MNAFQGHARVLVLGGRRRIGHRQRPGGAEEVVGDARYGSGWGMPDDEI